MRLIANGTQASSTMPTPAAASGTPGYANNAAPGVGVTPTALFPDDINILYAELMAILTAAGVSPDSTGAITNQVLASLRTLFGFRSVVLYSSSGTFTVPAFVTKVKVTVIAGGGGGGGSSACSSAQVSAAPGGNGGSWGTKIVNGLTPGETVTITVGAGGAAGGATGGNGGPGGASSFGTYITALGGGGGAGVPAGSPPLVQAATTVSQLCIGGDFNGAETSGGHGVGSGLLNAVGGAGGNSPAGGGSAGGINGAAYNAIAFGNGGGGASTWASGSGHIGGAGSDGIIIVEY